MNKRMFQSVAALWSLKAGLLAVVSVFGLVASSQACNKSGGSPGGGSSGGSASGSKAGGGGGGGGGAGMAQAMMTAQRNQMQMQPTSNQYVASMQARHNQMVQQAHQRQYVQLVAMRQASQNKKAATDRTMNVSQKSKSNTGKPGLALDL